MDPCYLPHLISLGEEFSMETGTACVASGLPVHLETSPGSSPPVLSHDQRMAPLKSLDII